MVVPTCSPSTTTPPSRGPSPATCAGTTARTTGSSAPASGAEALEALREIKLRGEPGGRPARRLPDARDERHRVPRSRRWTCSRAPGAPCSPRTPTPTPRSRRSTSSTSTTTCSSPGTRRRRSSTRSSTRCSSRTRADAGRRGAPRPRCRPPLVGPSFEARDFLARNAVPYRWYASDEPEGARLLDAAGVDAATPAGHHHPGRRDAGRARRPAELAAAVGLLDRPGRPTSTTSSSSAAAPPGWAPRSTAPRRGCAPLLVERQATGGQAGQSLPDRELPRLP